MGFRPDNEMSNNEFLFWVARSSKKPLPAMREEFHQARNVFYSQGNCGKASERPYRSVSNAVIDWYGAKYDKDFMKRVREKLDKERLKNGG
jgi:hypothetical protein